jgi:hypothetical protein
VIVLLAALALFNGESLAEWKPVGEANWAVRGGAMVASGAGQGFLVSRAGYGDFELSLEFWVDETINSGVFIRCQDLARIHPDTCYEINIWDLHPRQEARTGAIVFRAMPPLARVDTIGRWNRMDVTARGPVIEVRVNGTLTARLTDAEPAPGFIALQHWETGVVKFRKVELTLLEQ